MQTAAAYIRVSTKDQAELSPDSQIKLVRDYAKAHDMILPDDLIFRDDGISGRRAEKRPEFMRMISAAKQKPRPFDVILLWKFSRFARNQEESIVYKSLLKRDCGVDVVSVSEPLAEGPFGSLIERILEWMDEFYSVRLAGEVRRGMAEKASRGGIVSTPPFGYKVENGAFVPNPDTAPAVQKIFEMFLSGVPMRQIAEEMNDLGYRLRRGGRFEARTVKYILLNPTYLGKIRFSPERSGDVFKRGADNQIVADGQHEPLISEEMFEKAQELLAFSEAKYMPYRRETRPGDYMLKGLVRCDCCGATLVKTCTNQNGSTSYQCSNYARGSCQVSHSVVDHVLNEFAIYSIEQALISGNIDLHIIRRSPEAADDSLIERQIQAEQRKLQRVKEAYAAGVDTLQEYQENKRKISAAIKALQAKKPGRRLDPEKIKREFIKQHLKTVKDLKRKDISDAEKNRIIKSFVETMTFSKTPFNLKTVFYFSV